MANSRPRECATSNTSSMVASDARRLRNKHLAAGLGGSGERRSQSGAAEHVASSARPTPH
jgi:hypothetical protein